MPKTDYFLTNYGRKDTIKKTVAGYKTGIMIQTERFYEVAT